MCRGCKHGPSARSPVNSPLLTASPPLLLWRPPLPLQARRFQDALRDADAAVRLAPHWSKAHWRRGAALLGLKRAPEAALAYREAWVLADCECTQSGRVIMSCPR